jgi:hypothetical protein
MSCYDMVNLTATNPWAEAIAFQLCVNPYNPPSPNNTNNDTKPDN